MNLRTLVCAAGCVLLALGRARGAVTLTSQEGEVAVLRGGEESWHPAIELPFELQGGDRVRTGRRSAAVITAAGGAKLGLAPETELSLDRDPAPYEASVALLSGAIQGRISREEISGLRIRGGDAFFLPLWGSFDLVLKKGGSMRAGVRLGLLKVTTASWEEATLSSGRQLWVLPGRPLGQSMAYAARPPSEPPAGRSAPAAPPMEEAPVRTSGEDLGGILDALEENPDDPAAKAGLDRFTKRLSIESRGLFEAEEKDADGQEDQAVLRKTYRVMNEQVENEAAQDIFRSAQDAFDAGRYLLAADRFLLCRLLEPSEPWLAAALDEYLERQIPQALEADASAKRQAHPGLPPRLLRLAFGRKDQGADPAGAAERYAAILKPMRRLDWPAALREAGSFLKENQGLELESVREIHELSGRLETRLSSADPTKGEEGRLVDIMRSAEASPERAVGDLEALLYRFPDQTGEPWWQKASEALRRAYSNRDIALVLTRARQELGLADVKRAMQSLVEVLKKSPGNAEALALLDEMQKPRTPVSLALAAPAARNPDALPVQTLHLPEASKRIASGPPAEAASAPVAPTLKDMVQADAFYERGLKAYLRGELSAAASEWRSALKFNPGHAESKKNLARTLREIGIPLAEGGGR